jgi:uncharacterized protein
MTSTRIVVVAGGHRTDEPGRAEPRFSESAVPRVAAQLAAVLARWGVGPGDLLITGGARGADILAAEAALARGAAVRLLLAFPVDELLDRSIRLRAGQHDEWENRFRRVLAQAEVRVQEGDASETAETRFERNNRWYVEEAVAEAPSEGIRGLLVWDRRSETDRRGGTGDLAKELDRVGAQVEVIDPTQTRSYADRERGPGPKRLLSLDGGGIRGALTLEVLKALEDLLRTETGGGDDFVLGDWFDYIAGTSTGAIIAAGLAWGMSVRTIEEFYRRLGRSMFRKPILPRRFWYRYRADTLTTTLKEVFGEETTFGDPRLRTLLMMVLRNDSTDSPWPLSNATVAKFNDRSLPDCNLDLPLWQLVRGSTAAPTYFPAEVIRIGGRKVIFSDGGVTSFNNPAFQLFLMATLKAYGLGWETGEDRLLLVSVGTGYHPSANENLKLSGMHLMHNMQSVPSALMFAALMQQDLLCRVFGRCLVGGELDAEVGNLHAEPGPGGTELFTYLRYNADLSTEGLARLGLGHLDSEQMRRLDAAASFDGLQEIGRAVATRDLRREHFAAFI